MQGLLCNEAVNEEVNGGFRKVSRMSQAVGSGPQYRGFAGRKVQKTRCLAPQPVQEAPTHPGLAPGGPEPADLVPGPPVHTQRVGAQACGGMRFLNKASAPLCLVWLLFSSAGGRRKARI